MNNDISNYKAKLEEELELLKKELGTVGRVNPDNPGMWEAKPTDTDILRSDEDEVADKIEAYGENVGILNHLEIRYKEVENALKKIDSNSYGLCENCGQPIEKERLDANPAATTCLKHMKPL